MKHSCNYLTFISQVHFIFRHQSPITKEWEEKHLALPPTPSIDELTRLYTLIVNPDNTYEILIDDESKSTGSLLEDFQPPVNPSAEIGTLCTASLPGAVLTHVY